MFQNSTLIRESLTIGGNHWESVFTLIWESIPDLFQNHQESLRIGKNHQELVRINENQSRLFENQFQTYSRIIENQWESLRFGKNQWESVFRLIQESIPNLFQNHWESTRIGKNHQELERINENQSLDLFENQFQHLFQNHWESARIIENQWESSRFGKNQWESVFRLIWESIPDLFKNRWESMRISLQTYSRINSRLIQESLRISENHQELVRISL